MERKTFEEMTASEQNAVMDELERKEKEKRIRVIPPAYTRREGYYHGA